MKAIVSFFLLVACVLAGPLCVISQTPPEQKDDERLVVGANEVVLDAVVRDKKGKPIKDLQASDFQIIEDGVPQAVKSFRLVSGTADAAPASNNSSKDTAALVRRAINDFSNGRAGAVAMVFDRLSPTARISARDAALSYVNQGMAPNDFVGVYGVDLKLSTFQTFTNSADLVKKALEQVAATSTSSSSTSTQKIADLQKRNLDLTNQLDAALANAAGSQSMGNAASLAMEQRLNSIALNAEEGFEHMEQTQSGLSVTEGLNSLIAAMAQLPGRKSIVFFSEGVLIPSTVAPAFRNVIGNANRADVSIYTVDSAGLRAQSSNTEAGQAMTALGQTRIQQATSATDSFGSMMKDSERNEELVRHNPDAGLGQLADQTGGILVSGTNNLAGRLKQINEDLHSYYVLTYTPKNQNFDGAFRQVSIKVDRSSDVQTRKGYFALKSSYDSPVLPYEVPALAILDGKAPPNAFASKSGAYSFPMAGKPGLVPVFVEVPAGVVNFTSDTTKNTYASDFSIVVLLRDSAGRASRKLSTRYQLTGPLDQLDAAKKRPVMFYQETTLEPGDYTVDSIVYDATNKQSSVTTSQIAVPVSDAAHLRLSSLIVIQRTHQMAADEQQADNPFRVGKMIVFPNMGEAIHKAGSKGLSLFLNVYPGIGAKTTPKMKLEIDQNGQSLGQLPVDLPAPDQAGNIQYTATIPLDMFPPGEYGIKAIVTDGSTSASRAAHFNVQP